MKNEGTVVLVTGASSGIGDATARTLAGAGYRVFGGVRRPEAAATAPGVEYVRMDVQDDASVAAAVSKVIEKAGRIDIVINNAGVSLVGPVEATSDAEAHALFDVNVFGVLRVTRAVLPSMRNNRRGLVVNISSVLGFLPAPFMGLYASSKHALEGLSESLDHEVRAFGVRVVLVEPSFSRTNLDINATQTQVMLDEYASAYTQSVNAVRQQISDAPPPETVANKILSIVRGAYRLRQPADGRARLLSFLRRFAPSAQVDKSLRRAFGLQS
ncbi:short-chain dehydrogenase/reductase [Trinickia dabaoshanensis]|uniref:Short-chain dehydrogenase/reductase n=1 Tax=Trinickia dabaoshanensis TaxID=564714 RepID=A0A2N7VB21_9BURK|nr:oxidoreductase [Trinickia dabaoshanensis]PMS14362.1 short-chain dehydrogenase/reductase [Trinickia dabaoshanensis]